MTTRSRLTQERLRQGKPTAEQLEAARRAQELIRSFVPEGRALVDELIADRRAAAARGD